MGGIRIKDALGALVFAFCLLIISNYFGNTLIPSFNANHSAKIIKHDWIKWPKPENKIANSKSIESDLAELEITKILLEKDNKSIIKGLNVKQVPPTSEKYIAGLLLKGDPVKGKKIARKCVACHSFKKAGKNKIGPTLYGIMGRERGTTVGYNYSKALKKIGGKWGYADMDKFLLKPKNFLPGTKMSFKGIKKATDRAAIIMYIRSLAEIPLTLPK
jgi:cytochrome c2